MATIYHSYKIALTNGQKKKLQKAYVSKTAMALREKRIKLDAATSSFSLLLKSHE